MEEARQVLRLIGEEDYERELRDIIASIDVEHGHDLLVHSQTLNITST